MKLVLVYPRFKYPSGDPPLGLAYIASYVRNKLPDLDVSILDMTFKPSIHYLKQVLFNKKPDIVGIYCMTSMFNETIKIAKIAKKIGSWVIVGGPHSTIMPETLLNYKNIDAVIIGEGEKTVYQLVNNFESSLDTVKGIWYNKNGKTIKNDPQPPINDLNTIPFPAWDLLDMKTYFKNWFQLDAVDPSLRGTNILSARGCPFNCSFCQPTLRRIFGNKLRIRSVENVLDELRLLKEQYNIQGFLFADDTLTVSKKWVERFSKAMIKEHMDLIWGCNTRANTINEKMLQIMKKAGLCAIKVGAESGSQRVLNEIYQKGIKVDDIKRIAYIAKKNGIKTHMHFMLGAPTETHEEIQQTIKLACSLDIQESTFSITTPLPKTHLYEMIKNQGYDLSENFDDYDYYTGHASRGEIPFKKLRSIQRKAFLKFYLLPKRWGYLFSNFSSFQAIKKSFMKLKRLS